ncbi:hypothetical protein BH23GEM3_BH23GEM3_08780 [soil metagenome]
MRSDGATLLLVPHFLPDDGSKLALLSGAEDAVEMALPAARTAIHFASEPRLAALLAKAGFGPPLRFWGALLYAGWICERLR